MAKNYEIKTTFRAIDQISSTVGKMQTRVARFSASSTRAMRRLNQVTSKLTSGLTSGLKWGVLGAAGAITGLVAIIDKTAASMDKLAKTASALNFPIEEFQEFRFVADQSGVTNEVFDKSLKKFTRSMGELKSGSGSLYAALKKTDPGLLKQLQNTNNVADAFDIYLGAIGKAPNAMEKASLSAAGFGKAGVDMINMANLGSEEISKLRQEMRENGIVTAEQAAAAEIYNDMMNRLKLTISGFIVDALSPMMPMLTELADGARKWAVENKKIMGEKFKQGLKWLVDNLPEIIKYIKQFAIAVGVFYAISTAIKIATTAMELFSLVAAMNPIGLIILAIVAVIALIYVFRDELQAVAVYLWDKMVEVGGAIRDFFVGVWDWIMEKLGPTIDFIKEKFEFIGNVFRIVWTGISQVFGDTFDWFSEKIAWIVDAFSTGWEAIGDAFSSIWQGIKDAAASVFDWIMAKINAVVGAFRTVGSWFGMGDDQDDAVESGASGSTNGSVGVALSPTSPAVTLSRETSESVDRSEVTIRDETGRAKITRGNGRGIQLVHSGGMP